MTLSTNAKDYIASNLGRDDCFASSGIAYTDPRGDSHTGSTYDVVKTMKLGGTGPHGEWFDDIPDYRQITDSDIAWIGSNSYCVGVAPPAPPAPPIIPPTVCTGGDKRCYGGNVQTCRSDGSGWYTSQTCPYGCTNGICNDAPTGCVPGSRRCNGDRVEECNTSREWVYVRTCAYGCSGAGICNAAPVTGAPGGITETGPIEVIIKEGSPHAPGAPSVNLDTSKAFAYFKATPITYVGVMDIFVHNPSVYYAYFAWEMRMWAGKAGTTCPTTTPELQTISRFLGEVSDKKVISVKMLGANENAMIGGSFEIPAYFKGTYTLCLSLWGNYDKQALLDELLSDRGYVDEIPW